MKTLIARLLKDEEGASAIEYALIAALIAVAIIAGVGTLGEGLDSAFTSIADTLKDAFE